MTAGDEHACAAFSAAHAVHESSMTDVCPACREMFPTTHLVTLLPLPAVSSCASCRQHRDLPCAAALPQHQKAHPEVPLPEGPAALQPQVCVSAAWINVLLYAQLLLLSRRSTQDAVHQLLYSVGLWCNFMPLWFCCASCTVTDFAYCCPYLACCCLHHPSPRRVYFHLLMTRTEELLPYIYTPTVGEACETYHELPMLTQVRQH